MGISIKNEEVEELIRQMADAMNKPITDAVRIAALEWLHANGARRRTLEEERQNRIDQLVAQGRGWPVYDDRDHGDMLYDDSGLPK